MRAQPMGGCKAAAPPNPQKLKFKNADFVHIMISKALPDLPFSGNQPLKLADD
jgi:hypothetical protein